MIKDSGERREFETGSVRDAQSGKGRFDLIPYLPQELLAKHYEEGIGKYGERNWEKGQPLKVFLDSALRHLSKFASGARDENHLSAAVWNIYGYQWTENEIIEGRLPFSLTKDLQPNLIKHIEDEMEDKNIKELEGYLEHWMELYGNVKYLSRPAPFGWVVIQD